MAGGSTARRSRELPPQHGAEAPCASAACAARAPGFQAGTHRQPCSRGRGSPLLLLWLITRTAFLITSTAAPTSVTCTNFTWIYVDGFTQPVGLNGWYQPYYSRSSVNQSVSPTYLENCTNSYSTYSWPSNSNAFNKSWLNDYPAGSGVTHPVGYFNNAKSIKDPSNYFWVRDVGGTTSSDSYWDLVTAAPPSSTNVAACPVVSGPTYYIYMSSATGGDNSGECMTSNTVHEQLYTSS